MKRQMCVVILASLFTIAAAATLKAADGPWDIATVEVPRDHAIRLKLHGTPRLPGASGEAKIEHQSAATRIEIELEDLKPASLFGGDFNTYVLWIVSPEGGMTNAGECVLKGGRCKLSILSMLNAFGLFMTAEPHYLVNLPSRFVVLEIEQTPEQPALHCRGFQGNYNYERDTLAGAKEARGPVENGVKQAFTAFQLAQRAGASEFAREELVRAKSSLDLLMLSEQGKDHREVESLARETVRIAFTAQQLAEQRRRNTQNTERLEHD